MHTFYDIPPIEVFDDFVESLGDDMDFIHKAAEGLPLYGNRTIRMLSKIRAITYWSNMNGEEVSCLKHCLNIVPSIWGIEFRVYTYRPYNMSIVLEGNGKLNLEIGPYLAKYVFHDKNGFGEGGINLEVSHNIMLDEMLDKIRERV